MIPPYSALHSLPLPPAWPGFGLLGRVDMQEVAGKLSESRLAVRLPASPAPAQRLELWVPVTANLTCVMDASMPSDCPAVPHSPFLIQ